MHNAIIPDWIKAEADRQEREAFNAIADTDSKQLAELTVKAEMPEYWRHLLMELTLNAEGLTEFRQVNGYVASFGHNDYENQFRVSVRLVGATARQTYTHLFHLVGNSVIRCHTLGGRAFQLQFVVRPDGRRIGLIANDDCVVMSPEKAAEYIVRPMVKWLKASSSDLY